MYGPDNTVMSHLNTVSIFLGEKATNFHTYKQTFAFIILWFPVQGL